MEEAPSQISLRDDVLSMYRHRRWILTPVIVSLLIAAAYDILARSVYVTEAVVSIEAVSRTPGVRQVVDPPSREDAMQKQLSLLNSPDFLEGVVDSQTGPDASKELASGPVRTGLGVVTGAYRDLVGPGRPAASKSAAIEALQSRIVMKRTSPSSWIRIEFSSYDPDAGAAALNTLVEHHQKAARSANEAAVLAEREAIDLTVGSQKSRVGGALSARSSTDQANSSAYQRPLLQKKLAALQDELAEVSSRLVTLSAELAQSGRDLDLGTAADSPRAEALRTKLDDLNSDLAAKQETLGERHPEVQALLSQVRSTEGSLRSEIAIRKAQKQREVAVLTRQKAELAAAMDRGAREASSAEVSSFDSTVLTRQADAGERALSELIERSQKGGDTLLFEPRIVQRAEPGRTPAYPRRLGNYLNALVAGVLIGLVVTRLRVSTDETLRTVDDLKRLSLGLPLLGVVPLDPKVARDGLSARMASATPLAEAFRVIKTNLPEDVRVISVTSARPGDGKSTSAAALAMLLSRTGEKVLLIDGDLRRPSLSRTLGVVSAGGFDRALKSGVWERYVVPVGSIDFMPTGKGDPNAAEQLSEAALEVVLASAREHYRYIVIDTPPALAIADALTIGRKADGSVLIVAAGHTYRGALVATVEQLQGQGIRILGVVLNQVDFRDMSESYGRYYAQYGKYYTKDAPKPKSSSGWFAPPAGRRPPPSIEPKANWPQGTDEPAGREAGTPAPSKKPAARPELTPATPRLSASPRKPRLVLPAPADRRRPNP